MNRIRGFAFFAIGLFCGGVLVYFLTRTESKPTAETVTDRHSGQIGLINPLLECSETGFTESPKLRDLLLQEAKQLEDQGVTVAYYFRDLNNGPWVGLRERDPFIGGSLLKVAILIGYLKAAESDPTLMQKLIKAGPVPTLMLPLNQNTPIRKAIQQGRDYTVEELLNHLIVYSDNQAVALLLNAKLGVEPTEVMKSLGIRFDVDPQKGARLTVRDTGSFFRVLYNSSYLTRAMSQKALELLTRSDFKEGLAAGVPTGIIVAHKFGEREDGKEKQLHDCGIVYHPQKPYLLCVMTKGDDFQVLKQAIAKISSLVFKTVTE